MKVIDTTVAVDHLRGRAAAVELLGGLIERMEPVAASEIVRYELLAGVRDAEHDTLEQFSQVFSWVPVGEDVVRTAAELARVHRKAHSGIDDADYLIAATALVLDADLLTTNVRHFPMFPELQPAY